MMPGGRPAPAYYLNVLPTVPPYYRWRRLPRGGLEILLEHMARGGAEAGATIEGGARYLMPPCDISADAGPAAVRDAAAPCRARFYFLPLAGQYDNFCQPPRARPNIEPRDTSMFR